MSADPFLAKAKMMERVATPILVEGAICNVTGLIATTVFRLWYGLPVMWAGILLTLLYWIIRFFAWRQRRASKALARLGLTEPS